VILNSSARAGIRLLNLCLSVAVDDFLPGHLIVMRIAAVAIKLTGDYEELKAEAEGRKSFRRRPIYERLKPLSKKEYDALSPGERLSFGLYLTAERLAASMKEVA
jgi:hypothetical protein